jgi:hypothetical protein
MGAVGAPSEPEYPCGDRLGVALMFLNTTSWVMFLNRTSWDDLIRHPYCVRRVRRSTRGPTSGKRTMCEVTMAACGSHPTSFPRLKNWASPSRLRDQARRRRGDAGLSVHRTKGLAGGFNATWPNLQVRRRGKWVSKGWRASTVLPQRHDAFCSIDETHALHPLHLRPALNTVPETSPWGGVSSGGVNERGRMNDDLC